MSPAFHRALARTLAFEGGTADSPIDRGGFTHRGITQHTYDAWRTRHGLPRRGVVFIEDDELDLIAYEEYWLPCQCDEYSEPLAAVVFDMAFNSGPGDAIRALQVAMHVHADGVLGPVTLAAARTADSRAPLRVLKARIGHLQEVIADDPVQVGNLEGWGGRLLDLAWSRGE